MIPCLRGGVAYNKQRMFVEQIPLGECFRKPALRLFVPKELFHDVRFLVHHDSGSPTHLRCVSSFSKVKEDGEEETENVSSYREGHLYEFEERDQTLLIVQRIRSDVCVLSIIDVVEKELFVRSYELSVLCGGTIVSSEERFLREKYKHSFAKLLPFYQPNELFAQGKENDARMKAGEERGRQLAREMLEKMRRGGG